MQTEMRDSGGSVAGSSTTGSESTDVHLGLSSASRDMTSAAEGASRMDHFSPHSKILFASVRWTGLGGGGPC
jgi:hypothetical protein